MPELQAINPSASPVSRLVELSDALDAARTQFGFWAGLKSKKFALAFIVVSSTGTFALSLFTAAGIALGSTTPWVGVGLAACGAATCLASSLAAGLFCIAQAYSDAAQCDALARGASADAVNTVED
jgi:hypothetical protein